MSNFVSKIIFEAVDNVSKVAAKINGSIKTMELTNRKLGVAFGDVAIAGAAFANKLKWLGLAAGGAGVGLFFLADKTSNAAEAILNLSQKTGVSVEELQRLSYVSEQAGLSTDSLSTAMKFLNKSIAEASANLTGEAATAFSSMGIAIEDANGNLRSTEQIFYDLSDVFESSPDGANKVRTALTLLGRAGSELIPILNRGSKAIREEGLEFDKFGNLMSKAELEQIGNFGDRVNDLRIALKGLGSVIAQAVIPYFEPLVTKLANYVAVNKDLIKLNIASFVESFAKGFKQIWDSVTNVASIVGDFLDKIGGVKTVLLAIGAYIGGSLIASFAAFAASVVRLGAVFLASPWGLVIASIGAIGFAISELDISLGDFGKAFIGTIEIMAEKFGSFIKWVWGGVREILTALKIIDDEKKRQQQETLERGETVTNNGFSTTLGEDGVFRTAAAQDVTQNPSMTSSTTSTSDGFSGVLEKIASLASSQKQIYEMNMHLDSENKVTYLDIDAPFKTTVNVSQGAMLPF